VIFYEPVSSEIRTIQRRGRTGRHREGEVVVLIAEDTRDEGAMASSERREEFMQRAVHRVRRKLHRSPHTDLSNLGRFQIDSGDGTISASEFVSNQRQRHRIEITESDVSTLQESSEPPTLPPDTFRAKGQAGLEQFGVESVIDPENGLEQDT
jgi:Fanconi anemia group M protein